MKIVLIVLFIGAVFAQESQVTDESAQGRPLAPRPPIKTSASDNRQQGGQAGLGGILSG